MLNCEVCHHRRTANRLVRITAGVVANKMPGLRNGLRCIDIRQHWSTRVTNIDERRPMGCRLECRGDHHGERLAEVGNLAGVERQFHPGEVGQHSKHVTVPQCGTGVHVVDAAACHRAAHQRGVHQSRNLVVGRVRGFPGHLELAVDPGNRLAADELRHGGQGCVMASPPRWPVVSRQCA